MKPTKEQIIEAINKSIEHHIDGVIRTKENYYKFKMDSSHCALCAIYNYVSGSNTCKQCILHDGNYISPCAKEFYQAIDGRDEHDFPKFHSGEVALVRRLRGELDKLKDGKDTLFGDKKQVYQVGDEFVAKSNPTRFGNVWWGMKCKIVRFDKKIANEYEMIAYEDNYVFAEDNIDRVHPIVHCIDPKFWTVEKDGVLYRAYEDGSGNTQIFWCDKDGNKSYDRSNRFDLPYKIIARCQETLQDYLKVPVMPFGYMGDDYRFEYPEWENK